MKNAVLFLIILLWSVDSYAQNGVKLSTVWVRMADPTGDFDRNNDTASAESAEFSPDETLVVAGTKRGADVSVWRVEDGTLVWRQDVGEEVEAVAFSPDGAHVVAGSEDGLVHVFRASDGTHLSALDHGASVEGLRFSPDGRILATGSEAGEVNLWRAAPYWSHRHTLRLGEDQDAGGPQGAHADVNQVDWTSDGRYLAAASRNHDVTVWEVPEDGPPQKIRTLEGHRGSVKSARFSPDGRLVAAGAGSASGVRVWDAETGEEVAHIPATGMIMEAVAFTPDGRYLVTAGNEGEGDIGAEVENPGFENNDGFGHIRFYRIPAEPGGSYELALEQPVFRQEYLHFTDDGRHLLTAHEDGSIRLWSVENGTPTGALEDGVLPGQFSLHGNYPNPFHPTTTVVFDLPERAVVGGGLFDMLGRRLLTLQRRTFSGGAARQLVLDLSGLSSGTYCLRLEAVGASAVVAATRLLTISE